MTDNKVSDVKEMSSTMSNFFFHAIANETIRAHRQIEIINKEKQIMIDFISEQAKNPAIRSEKDLEDAIVRFIIDGVK
jgi:hypothetical protein